MDHTIVLISVHSTDSRLVIVLALFKKNKKALV